MFMMLDHSDVGISYSCQILLLYGAKTNKTFSVNNKTIVNKK